ncbi:MAG: signal peptide peptidase SppA [Myxococcota bacterium]|nr:signal peptide peptidase SppA [Myxococcota bacterium]
MSLIWSFFLAVLAWLPLQLVRFLRRRQLRLGGVVRIKLEATARPGSSSERARQIERIREMADDEHVKVVFFRLEGIPVGWASMQDLREAIITLNAAGKKTAAHLDQAGNGELYLASAAERVWMPPPGDLFLSGLGGRLSFFGNILARLGVQVDMVAAGAYKSFGEPFTRSFASPANREQMGVLYGDLQDQMVSAIALGRGKEPAEISALLARSPLSVTEAVELGLIDAAAYADQVEERLEKLAASERVRVTSWRGYGRLRGMERWLVGLGQRGRSVAVVHLEGSVVLGGEGSRTRRIEARAVVPVLDALAEDESIKAVVLRVDSGGGSAVASDLIARAVERLGRTRPVIALYGNISASGGYYLSVPAREIIARPGSITGSIGVIGGKVVVADTLGRQGLTSDFIDVGPDVGFLGPWRPFTPDQRARFEGYLDRTYDVFLKVVAGGRRCPVEAIRPYAGGRVWTGRQAKENGLIDHLGGLPTAINRAKMLSDIQPGRGRVVHIDFAPSPIRALASRLSRGQLVGTVLGLAGKQGELVEMLREEPGRALAMMPWVLEK